MRDIIQHKMKHYLIIIALGIIAGLLVCFFSNFPYDDLWSFSLFSSMTLGFWMFTCPLIVFISKQRKTAVFSVGLYVYFMFLLTGAGKIIRTAVNYGSMPSALTIFTDIIFYGVIPSVLCGILAAILFSAKERNAWGNVLLILPAVYLAIEAVYMILKVIFSHTNLFMSIIDISCIILYFYIFRNEFKQIMKRSN